MKSGDNADMGWGGKRLLIHLCHVYFAGALLCLYKTPLYRADIYGPWRKVFPLFVILLALFGWIPLKKIRHGISGLRKYSYFVLVAMTIRRFPGRRTVPRRGTYWKHTFTVRMWLLILLKSVFLPLAVGGIWYGYGKIHRSIEVICFGLGKGWSVRLMCLSVVLLIEQMILLLGSVIACLAYTVENRKWGYPFIAIDTSVMAWIACLVCYYPGNRLLDFLYRFAYQGSHEVPMLVVPGEVWAICVKSAAVAFMAVNLLGTVYLGMRYANLSYRGIVNRGPFAFVRHPQYASKIMWFLLELFPFFGNPYYVLFFFLVALIYIYRVMTEEKFLARFDDYRAYRKKVKWRMIPGVW